MDANGAIRELIDVHGTIEEIWRLRVKHLEDRLEIEKQLAFTKGYNEGYDAALVKYHDHIIKAEVEKEMDRLGNRRTFPCRS